ncbi:MAG: hypothetical protein NC911_06605 [Candidatus Omnitrophica bacterium]|nr:hypothetical protein [Candidatus Omnitrophota bacterium]MCM8769327.1 hypothetical protein [Candidatus Omnitrophota bacterium]
MKLSEEQFSRVKRHLASWKAREATFDFRREELRLIQELARQMSDRAVRHLNYRELQTRLRQVTPKEIARKIVIRRLTDFLISKAIRSRSHPVSGKK